MPANGKTTITWLGHAAFKIEGPNGETVLIDPFLNGNPKCPENLKKVERADVILVTHGHGDHIGDAAVIAKNLKATVVGTPELCGWIAKNGVSSCSGMNKGGSQEFGAVKVTMVSADHSSGITDDGAVIYGGAPVGYVLEIAGGAKVYHAGDTNVFGDMKLIGDLYAPDIAMLPIGGHYTMSPREAALAIRLLGVGKVIPMHFGTFPPLRGTPDQLRSETAGIEGVEVIELDPGRSTSV